MFDSKSTWEVCLDGITVLAAVAAVTFAAVRLFGTPPAGSGPVALGVEREIEDWDQYVENGRRIGPTSATVTILEFGDYECPVCRSVAPWLDAIQRAHTDDVALVYRHFPLSYHRAAYPAARAAECAGEQGRFAEYHRLLYSSSAWLLEPMPGFLELAARVDVPDTVTFEACVRDSSPVGSIEGDLAAGRALGVPGTPAIAINGRLLAGGQDSTQLSRLVEKAMR